MRHIITLILLLPALAVAYPSVRYAEYDVWAGTLAASGFAGIDDAEVELVTDLGSLGMVPVRVSRGYAQWRYRSGPTPEGTRWLKAVSTINGESAWHPVTVIEPKTEVRYAIFDLTSAELLTFGYAEGVTEVDLYSVSDGIRGIGTVPVTDNKWEYRGQPGHVPNAVIAWSPIQVSHEFPATHINESWAPEVVRTVQEVRAAGGVVTLEAGLSVEIDTTGLDVANEISWRSETPSSGHGFVPLTGSYRITHNADQAVPITVVTTAHNPADSVFFIEYRHGFDWVHDGTDGPTLAPSPATIDGSTAKTDTKIHPGERKQVQASKSEVPYIIERQTTFGGRTVELHYPSASDITSQRIALILNQMRTSNDVFDEDLTCQVYGTSQLIQAIVLPDVTANLGFTGRAVSSGKIYLAENVEWLTDEQADSLIAHEMAHVQTFHVFPLIEWLANQPVPLGKESIIDLLWTIEAYAVEFEYYRFPFSNDSWAKDNAIDTIFPKWVSPRWGLRSRTQLHDIRNNTEEPRYQYQLGRFLVYARDEAIKTDGSLGYNIPTLCEYFGDPMKQAHLVNGNANAALGSIMRPFSQYVTEINLGRGPDQGLITWDKGPVTYVHTDNLIAPTDFLHGAGIAPALHEGETMVMTLSWHPTLGRNNDAYMHFPDRTPWLWIDPTVVEKDTGVPVGFWNTWMTDGAVDGWRSNSIRNRTSNEFEFAVTPVTGSRLDGVEFEPIIGDGKIDCFLFGNISRIPGVVLYDESTYPCEEIGQ